MKNVFKITKIFKNILCQLTAIRIEDVKLVGIYFPRKYLVPNIHLKLHRGF
jgi:hypothetical protein